jgi:hypothetical protein
MTTLLRVSDQEHKRILTAIGAGFVALCVVGVLLYFTAISPSGGPAENAISVAVETPYVGQGVADGTAVILHGVEVGKVKQISKLGANRIRLDLELQKGPTKALTDAVGIDFRPANYFGVTGINLTPSDHGQILRNGATISVTPTGNFTLQTLLYRLGGVTRQVVTPQLINVIEKATRYTDALNPLFETMIQVSTTVTNVQKVSTEQLLRNAAAITVGLPPFLDGTFTVIEDYLKNDYGTGFDPVTTRAENASLAYYDKPMLDNYNQGIHELATDPDKFVFGREAEWLTGARFDLFSKLGTLLSSHTYDLFPLLDQVRVLADVVPRLVSPTDLSFKLGELRSRLERMYAGSGEQRALQVRIVLDQLPGVAAPMGLMLGAGG